MECGVIHRRQKNQAVRPVTMSGIYKLSLQITLAASLCLPACVTTQRISYKKDVRPILVDKCVRCHTPPYGEGYRKTSLDMTSYDGLMAGSIYGPVIIPRDSKKSPLNMLLEGRAGALTRILESEHKPVTELEIRTLQLWVEQGAMNN